MVHYAGLKLKINILSVWRNVIIILIARCVIGRSVVIQVQFTIWKVWPVLPESPNTVKKKPRINFHNDI